MMATGGSFPLAATETQNEGISTSNSLSRNIRVLLLIPILRLKWCEMPRAGVRTLVGVSITCGTRRGFSEGLMVLPQRCARHGASGDLPPAQDLAWRRLEVALKTGGWTLARFWRRQAGVNSLSFSPRPRERMHSCLGAGDAVRHGLAGRLTPDGPSGGVSRAISRFSCPAR